MATFSDAEDLKRVFGGFLAEAAASDDDLFGGSGIVVAYVTTDPAVRFVMDARATPEPGKHFAYYVDDANAPEPDVEFTTSADTLDALYSGDAKIMALAMTGRLKFKGDMSTAMRLLPVLDHAVPRYRAYRNK